MNAWKNTHLPSTVIQSERPEDLLPFLGLTLSEFSLPPEVTAYSLHTSKSAVEWGKERASFVQPGVIENVRKITDHHIMRLGGEPQQEMQAIDLISSSTEIPAPKGFLSPDAGRSSNRSPSSEAFAHYGPIYDRSAILRLARSLDPWLD
ncbi:SubName: Full=Uncharacterized protein {ECO:0000313/EMBL:CCA74400.1} [Serendipita indica DSM 11827]|nr:SubName: Full=Uncharacterized protein {ECO:0000313/EMBL:CCA74400.1} [Serendipita indica DSM 11827]